MGIAGCGAAARIHLDRLLAREEVEIVGCADPELSAARALADRAAAHRAAGEGDASVPAFTDHRQLLRAVAPEALAIFTPHLSHYRLAMDALQAGCHLFVEKPLSMNVQEAADIVGLARGRQLKVGVGHQYRLAPSLVEVRRRLAAGAIGPVRLIVAILARPWVGRLGEPESRWRFHPEVAGGGILADAGDHLLDALLWTTGRAAQEVCAFQSQRQPGIDLVTAAAICLRDGTAVTLAISGNSPGALFVLEYFGEHGRLRATEETLEEERSESSRQVVPLPPATQTIDGDFVSALREETPLCCPADQALETVRLLEAIGRSAATRQVVRLI
jgi:predicted dehydrogenase